MVFVPYALRYCTHRFSVYGVHGKEKASHERRPDRLASEHQSAELHVEEADGAMEQDVRQVVARRLQSVQEIVEPERGDG